LIISLHLHQPPDHRYVLHSRGASLRIIRSGDKTLASKADTA
jgi:hypothetical protein